MGTPFSLVALLRSGRETRKSEQDSGLASSSYPPPLGQWQCHQDRRESPLYLIAIISRRKERQNPSNSKTNKATRKRSESLSRFTMRWDFEFIRPQGDDQTSLLLFSSKMTDYIVEGENGFVFDWRKVVKKSQVKTLFEGHETAGRRKITAYRYCPRSRPLALGLPSGAAAGTEKPRGDIVANRYDSFFFSLLDIGDEFREWTLIPSVKMPIYRWQPAIGGNGPKFIERGI